METSYFTELFSRKKDEFCIQIMNKKVSKESKCQKKTFKKNPKKIIMIKIKRGYFI